MQHAVDRGPTTVLLAWELGSGGGHVGPLLRIARGLAAHGLRPVLAVKDLVEAWPFLRDEPFPVLQAPRPRSPEAASFLAASYADVLAAVGFADLDALLPLVQGWEALFDLVRPALVVGDHSPLLCLAAYGALPTALTGTGFVLPPAHLPDFPLMVLDRRPAVPENQLLGVVREMQLRRGRPAPESLPGLFAAAERFLTIVPEMDPYAHLRREPHLGPLEAPPPPLPSPERPTFFAYLDGSADWVAPLLSALLAAGRRGRAYLRGAPAGVRESLRREGLEVLDRPPPLAEALAGAAAVVHHGGAGTAHTALFAGRPQLLFPRHLEQILNSQLLQRLGVAPGFTGELDLQAAAEALGRLLHDPVWAERATSAARSLHERGPWDPLPRVVSRCLELVG